MDNEPTDEPDIPETSEILEVTHRKRRRSAWQKTPKWVKVSVAVCLGLLVITVLTQGWIMNIAKSRVGSTPAQTSETQKKARIEANKTVDSIAAKLQPFDLELVETALNPKTRRIEGFATNKSDRAYSDIRITFALPSRDLRAQDWTIVTIERLPARGRTKFVSDQVPKGVQQWALVGLTGTPR